MRLALVAAVALLIGCSRAPQSVAIPVTLETPPRLQLPSSVTPLAYQLDLTVFPERQTFAGRVRIDIRFDARADAFWIHGRNLQADTATLHGNNGDVIPATYQQVTADGVVRITLARPIEPQTAQLDISYHGAVYESLEGLFHVRVDGDWYAFTQFEPIDARAVFPAFDEPRFKTPFVLSIVAPSVATVAANTPAAEIVMLPNSTKRVRFEPTTPLPTYLVAFAVGPLDVVDGAIPLVAGSAALPLRGLAVKGRGPQFGYALNHTPDLVTRLVDYFALPYPFAKLDLVVIPTQRSAMENAALITYGEYSMLLGANAPLAQQRTYAFVHAHELAHQWFGDLVTMRWWDDLWLNEAFATFLSFKIVQDWRPSYHAQEELVQASLAVMSADRLASARRIREPIESVNDIINAFDGITYSKGAGVLNMLDGYLGATAFRDGIRAYLKQHAGGSADVHDLIAALAQASGRSDLNGIITTFTEQPGTPWIDVQLDCSAPRPTLNVSQRRYLPVGSKAAANVLWHVPVCVRFGAEGKVHEQCFLLNQPSATVALEGVAHCPTWLMPNRSGRGYYRWHMADAQLDQLNAVLFSELDAGERLSFADGLSAGVAAGDIELAAFFQKIPRLLQSDDRYLLMSPVPIWRAVQRDMLNASDQDASRALLRSSYGPALATLRARGIGNDEDQLTQVALVNLLAVDGRDDTIRADLSGAARALVGFAGDGRAHPGELDVNLWDTALRVAVQDLDKTFGEHLAALLVSTSDPALRAALLGAIGSANDVTLAQRVALDGTIRGEELPELVQAMFDLENGRQNWPWLVANIDTLIDRVTPFGRSGLIHMTAGFCSRDNADAVAALFEPRLDRIDGGRRALDQTLERIALCAALKTTYQQQARMLFE